MTTLLTPDKKEQLPENLPAVRRFIINRSVLNIAEAAGEPQTSETTTEQLFVPTWQSVRDLRLQSVLPQTTLVEPEIVETKPLTEIEKMDLFAKQSARPKAELLNEVNRYN
jgi:hypothetical protein